MLQPEGSSRRKETDPTSACPGSALGRCGAVQTNQVWLALLRGYGCNETGSQGELIYMGWGIKNE